jgi:hypothetical protein
MPRPDQSKYYYQKMADTWNTNNSFGIDLTQHEAELEQQKVKEAEGM